MWVNPNVVCPTARHLGTDATEDRSLSSSTAADISFSSPSPSLDYSNLDCSEEDLLSSASEAGKVCGRRELPRFCCESTRSRFAGVHPALAPSWLLLRCASRPAVPARCRGRALLGRTGWIYEWCLVLEWRLASSLAIQQGHSKRRFSPDVGEGSSAHSVFSLLAEAANKGSPFVLLIHPLGTGQRSAQLVTYRPSMRLSPHTPDPTHPVPISLHPFCSSSSPSSLRMKMLHL